MKAASRYAKALLDLSLEQGVLETTYKDMTAFSTTCENNKDLINFLQSPIIKTDKKINVLNTLFHDLSKPALLFIRLITQQKRENYLPEIAKEFIRQYKQYKKITTAVVTTAVGLDDNLRSQVLKLVKGNKDEQVELIEKVDKNIIGGIILRVGDKQVDASIARKIADLRLTFAENPYLKN